MQSGGVSWSGELFSLWLEALNRRERGNARVLSDGRPFLALFCLDWAWLHTGVGILSPRAPTACLLFSPRDKVRYLVRCSPHNVWSLGVLGIRFRRRRRCRVSHLGAWLALVVIVGEPSSVCRLDCDRTAFLLELTMLTIIAIVAIDWVQR